MQPSILLSIIVVYFIILLLVAHFTSRKSSDNDTFFVANRNSKWYLVAFGMIGTSISGVTFISVPGTVGTDAFSYFQFVLGNAVGYVIIATVLMPLYYRMKLTSIYSYLEHRFGFWSYKTGAFTFLVSRIIGSAFRLFLVVIVLQHFIFDKWQIPFWLTVTISLLFIWAYTHKGGLKTIIITDTLQTFFLVLAVILSIIFIGRSMHLGLGELFQTIKESAYSKVFFWEDFTGDKRHFIKYFLGGIGVSVAMTGLDQDLMQKNLSMKTIFEAKKNMFSFTAVFILVNIFFLSVGALLYIFAQKEGIPLPHGTTDYIYPDIAFNHLGIVAAIVFIIGLTAATFATTDSALTALTTSFCVDFLGMDKKQAKESHSEKLVKTRKMVHILFSVIFLLVVIAFKYLISEAVVKAIFTVASYTYGPLLGMFMFGIFNKRPVKDKFVPFICILSPILCWLLNIYSERLLGGYRFSFELLIVNGILTFTGLWIISKKQLKKSTIA